MKGHTIEASLREIGVLCKLGSAPIVCFGGHCNEPSYSMKAGNFLIR
jgi:hypothetical protein